MLGPQGSSYGALNQKATGTTTTQSSAKKSVSSKRWLFALIATIGVLSLVGTFANVNLSYGQEKEVGAAPLMRAAPVSRAEIVSNSGKPCELYSGGAIEKNKKIFTTPINDKMILEFAFSVHPTSSRFANIIHVGAHNYEEWPSVYFTNWYWRGGPKIMIRFEKHGVSGFYHVEEAIKVDTEHLLRIAIDGLNCQVYLDGVKTQDFAIPAQYKPDQPGTLPVYAAGDWSVAATGTVGDVALCVDGAMPPTEAPTPAPTSSPTPAPTGSPTPSPTPAPTGSPTPAPTGSPTPAPTGAPTPAPTGSPTPAPTGSPSPAPTPSPTPAPTGAPVAPPAPSPSFCTTFDGPVRLGLDQKIMTVDIVDEYDVSFTINIDVGANSGNLFDIGGNLNDEAPRIWYWNSGTRMGIVKFRAAGGFRTEGYIDGKGLLPQGRDVDIEVKVRGLHFTVFVDGDIVLDRDMDSRSKFTRTGVPVEAVDNWGLVPATISNVRYCPACAFRVPGPMRLALDQRIGEVEITENYDVAFTINIDAGFTGSGNLIDFGADLVNEAPRFWYWSSGSRMGIVKFRNNNGFRTEGYIEGKGLLPQGRDVRIEIKVRGLHFTTYVDGVVVLDRDMDAASKFTGRTVPVEAASHWGLVPATIKDISLCHVL